MRNNTDTPSSDFTVRAEKLERAVVVSLAGEMDTAVVPHAINELRAVTDNEEGPVVLDVRGLTYIDTSGLGILDSIRAKLARQGRPLVAVGCHGVFEKTLRMARLHEDIPCFTSVEEAVAYAVQMWAPEG